MGTITKYKTVKVPYTVATVSAPHVSRLIGKMESPRQVPTWGPHTIGSMVKYTDNGERWGWEVTQEHYGSNKQEYVYVTYYRHPEMSSARCEIESIKVHLEEEGFEVSEPKYRYSTSYRRDTNGDLQDYEVESSVYLKVSRPEDVFSGHCQTCKCQVAEDL